MMGDIIGSDDKEKLIYSMQIKYLDQQLERLQLRCDELEQHNQDLASGCVAMTTDKADVAGYLKIAAAEAQVKLAELVELVESQSAASDRNTEALKLQHSRRETELQDRINKQNSDNTKLAAALEDQQVLEEQLTELTEQQCDVEAVKEKLLYLREELELTVFTLEEDAESEWQKELQERRSMEEEQMEKKIQNTVQEERAQHQEIRQKVWLLVEEESALLEEIIQLQQSAVESQVEDSQREVEALRGRSLACRKGLEEMRKTSHQLKVKLQDGGTTNERLQLEVEALRHLLTQTTEKERQRTSEAEELRAELRRGRSSRRSLEAVLQESAVVLSHTLKASVGTSSYRGEMLRLLEILQSAAPHGPGPTPEELDRGQRPQTRTQTPDPLFLMACYRPGDLGLVPRPSWKQDPALPETPPPPSRPVRKDSSYMRHVSSQNSAPRPSGSSEGPDHE
ncbi:cilia- and flagella-associated protein 157-like [Pungitius pungitius]|uniref:cilia- and flagella-associated protein 157-like n=1 Tax=Pungitius pungitius TaxID=134920 RepID=UPI002E10D4A2